jgi:peptidoglycan-N-acetylglucosamine deacetylase
MFLLKEPAFVIRNIEFKDKECRRLFLTFDDGPSDDCTSEVLAVLKKYKVGATFFTIGRKAEQHPDLIKNIISQNHALYSHSFDHTYFHYFKTVKHIKNWLHNSILHLNNLTHSNANFFRPPAGVLTPPLIRAAKNLHVPLIMWNHRFFDSRHSLQKDKIDMYLKNAHPGDIVLLHDHQKVKNKAQFLHSLDYLISQLIKKKFNLVALDQSDVAEVCRFN